MQLCAPWIVLLILVVDLVREVHQAFLILVGALSPRDLVLRVREPWRSTVPARASGPRTGAERPYVVESRREAGGTGQTTGAVRQMRLVEGPIKIS